MSIILTSKVKPQVSSLKSQAPRFNRIGSWFLVLGTLCLGSSSCGVYSFTGASTGEAKTVSIVYFKNNAALAPPTYSQKFTESLRDKFTSQTSLTLIPSSGDLNFEGFVSGYSTAPVAIQGNETAALNRLSITVNVTFTNNKDEKQNFEQSFTRFADFNSSQSLEAVQEQLITDINEQLVQDIFNKSVINW